MFCGFCGFICKALTVFQYLTILHNKQLKQEYFTILYIASSTRRLTRRDYAPIKVLPHLPHAKNMRGFDLLKGNFPYHGAEIFKPDALLVY